MMSLISIIVPVYNTAPYLSRCLESIFTQTYENIEVIAVDDGSTDDSLEILNQITQKHPRLRVIHQSNSGVTAARLNGVRAARGEYIGFVDSDDEIEADMYERLIKNAEAYQAEISHCGYQMVFADGRINKFYGTDLLAKQDKTTALKELLSGSRIEPGLCNKLFRNTLFHSLLHHDMMPTDIKINEDLLMNYILFSNADSTVFEDVCPYYYMVRGDSASRAPLNYHRIWDPITVKQKICDMQIAGMNEDAKRAYLSTCVNVYSGLMLDKSKAWSKDEQTIRKLILENTESFSLLSKKQRLLAMMIQYIPHLYRYIYRFYAKRIQKNPYV